MGFYENYHHINIIMDQRNLHSLSIVLHLWHICLLHHPSLASVSCRTSINCLVCRGQARSSDFQLWTSHYLQYLLGNGGTCSSSMLFPDACQIIRLGKFDFPSSWWSSAVSENQKIIMRKLKWQEFQKYTHREILNAHNYLEKIRLVT